MSTGYIYKNELDKASFQHDMAHRDFNPIHNGFFQGCSRIREGGHPPPFPKIRHTYLQ